MKPYILRNESVRKYPRAPSQRVPARVSPAYLSSCVAFLAQVSFHSSCLTGQYFPGPSSPAWMCMYAVMSCRAFLWAHFVAPASSISFTSFFCSTRPYHYCSLRRWLHLHPVSKVTATMWIISSPNMCLMPRSEMSLQPQGQEESPQSSSKTCRQKKDSIGKQHWSERLTPDCYQ